MFVRMPVLTGVALLMCLFLMHAGEYKVPVHRWGPE